MTNAHAHMLSFIAPFIGPPQEELPRMADTRFYLVTAADDGTKHLVDAANQSQAIRHVVRNRYSAKVVTNRELAKLLGDGMTIESAASE